MDLCWLDWTISREKVSCFCTKSMIDRPDRLLLACALFSTMTGFVGCCYGTNDTILLFIRPNQSTGGIYCLRPKQLHRVRRDANNQAEKLRKLEKHSGCNHDFCYCSYFYSNKAPSRTVVQMQRATTLNGCSTVFPPCE